MWAGTVRLASQKIALIGAVPPLMLKTESNPIGLPIDVFDGIRKGTTISQPVLQRPNNPFYGYKGKAP